MLIDEVRITVKAGDGGDGRVSFYNDAFRPKGGPDGGIGGDGGSVYFEAVSDVTKLNQFRHAKVYAAQRGEQGGKNNCTGHNGEDLNIEVPVGTLVNYDNGTSVELTQIGQKVLIARGGSGGRGNFCFKSSTNQTPKEKELGFRTQPKKLFLQLKLIAQVGLIGLPNAGKTSLLNELTSANAKVANYAFTTLEPNLGVMKSGLIIADIPGLIEGAADGKGLGDRFLKHVERTSLLIHCIAADSADPKKDYQTVRQELANYSSTLAKKPEIIVLTKTDTLEPKEITKIEGSILANDGLYNGKKVGRIPVEGVVPIAVGIVEHPAAHVEPIIIKSENKPEEKQQSNSNMKMGKCPECGEEHEDSEIEDEMITCGNCKKKTAMSEWKKESKSAEKEIISQNNNLTVTKNIENMKLTDIEKITDEALKDIKASTIREFIEQKLKEPMEKLVQEKRAKEEEIKAAEKAREELSKNHEEVKAQLQSLNEKLAKLQTEAAEKEKVDKFNQRMAHIDETYELDDDLRKIVASDLQGLDDEGFKKVEEKYSILFKDRNKAEAAKKKAKDEEEKKEKGEDGKKLPPWLDKKKAKASEDDKNVLDEAIKTSEKEKTVIANTTSTETPSLADRMKAAFTNKTISIDVSKKRKI